MENFMALKVLHVTATLLLLAAGLAVTVWLLRGRRGGELIIQNRALARPWAFAWALMALCLAIQPVSGWWLVHLLGWPLGQTWILGSSLLYTLGCLAWVWLVVRLNRLRRDGAAGSASFTLGLAVVSGACFVAIAGLLVLKPV